MSTVVTNTLQSLDSPQKSISVDELVQFRNDLFLRINRYSCVADMVADATLIVGQVVETLGYHNDWVGTGSKPKGGNRYEIVAGGTGTDDGGSFITLTNGLQAKGLFTDGVVNVCQFGAKGDGVTDDTMAIQSSMDVAHSIRTGVKFESNCTHIINKRINVWSYVSSIFSHGNTEIIRGSRAYFSSGTTLVADTPSSIFECHVGAIGKLHISGLTINGNNQQIDIAIWPDTTVPNQTYYGDISIQTAGPYVYGPSGTVQIPNMSWDDYTTSKHAIFVENCYFKDAPGSSVVGGGLQNITVTNCVFDGWFDHAVYAAGYNTAGGMRSDSIVVSNNIFRKLGYTRGNVCVKGRNFVSKFIVSNNTFDILDGFLTFDTGDVSGNIPPSYISVIGNTGDCTLPFFSQRGAAGVYFTPTHPDGVYSNYEISSNNVTLSGPGSHFIYTDISSFHGNIASNNVSHVESGTGSFITFSSSAVSTEQSLFGVNVTGNTYKNTTGSYNTFISGNTSSGDIGFANVTGNTIISTLAMSMMELPCKSMTINDNLFYNVFLNQTTSSKSLVVVGNSWNYNQASPVIGTSITVVRDSQNVVTFSNNTIDGGTVATTFRFASGKSTTYEVTNNIIRDCNNGEGITFGQSGYYPSSLKFINNTIQNSMGLTFINSGKTKSTYTGRTVLNISDNTYYGSTTNRFWTENTNGLTVCILSFFDDVFIIDNKIYNSTNAFYAFGDGISTYSGSSKIYYKDNYYSNSTVNFGYGSSYKTSTLPLITL